MFTSTNLFVFVTLITGVGSQKLLTKILDRSKRTTEGTSVTSNSTANYPIDPSTKSKNDTDVTTRTQPRVIKKGRLNSANFSKDSVISPIDILKSATVSLVDTSKMQTSSPVDILKSQVATTFDPSKNKASPQAKASKSAANVSKRTTPSPKKAKVPPKATTTSTTIAPNAETSAPVGNSSTETPSPISPSITPSTTPTASNNSNAINQITMDYVDQKADYCNLDRDDGDCDIDLDQYYYHNQSGRCRRFIYSGCGGNTNRFSTYDDCRQNCEGFRVERCMLDLEPGTCGLNITRWYFSSDDRKCMQFGFAGCKMNGNNFRTLEICQEVCKLSFTHR